MVDLALVLVDPGRVDAEALLRQVADDGLDALAAVPPGDQLLELAARALAHQHVDVALAVAQQLLDEVPADEAGGAGDEVGHGPILTLGH